MMLTCRSYTGVQAQAMHLVNFCYPEERFEAELAALAADIVANSWYSNQLNKRALLASLDAPAEASGGDSAAVIDTALINTREAAA